MPQSPLVPRLYGADEEVFDFDAFDEWVKATCPGLNDSQIARALGLHRHQYLHLANRDNEPFLRTYLNLLAANGLPLGSFVKP